MQESLHLASSQPVIQLKNFYQAQRFRHTLGSKPGVYLKSIHTHCPRYASPKFLASASPVLSLIIPTIFYMKRFNRMKCKLFAINIVQTWLKSSVKPLSIQDQTVLGSSIRSWRCFYVARAIIFSLHTIQWVQRNSEKHISLQQMLLLLIRSSTAIQPPTAVDRPAKNERVSGYKVLLSNSPCLSPMACMTASNHLREPPGPVSAAVHALLVILAPNHSVW